MELLDGSVIIGFKYRDPGQILSSFNQVISSTANFCNKLFQRNVNASGVVPQISLVMGPCAGKFYPSLIQLFFLIFLVL